MNQTRQKLFKIIFSTLLFGGISCGYSQTNDSKSLAQFSILVETKAKNIKFTSVEGCVWKELMFSLENDKVQAVDKYGIISSDEKRINKKSNSSNFIFTVHRIKDGIEFHGKKGTAWERLSFRCPKDNCQENINQNGRV